MHWQNRNQTHWILRLQTTQTVRMRVQSFVFLLSLLLSGARSEPLVAIVHAGGLEHFTTVQETIQGMYVNVSIFLKKHWVLLLAQQVLLSIEFAKVELVGPTDDSFELFDSKGLRRYDGVVILGNAPGWLLCWVVLCIVLCICVVSVGYFIRLYCVDAYVTCVCVCLS